MSMKWMGCPHHNLWHDPSEKPRESPTATTVTVRPTPSTYQAEVASFWPSAKVEVLKHLAYV